MSERRRAVRERRFAAGRIEFGHVGGVGCMIRNLSSTGALLEIGAPTDLPNKFALVVLSNRKRQICEVVRRQGHRYAVAFTGAESFGSTTTDPARQALVPAVAR
jgi:hypothetical protein